MKFLVYEKGRKATDFQVRNAHLVGADDIGVRADIRFEDGAIICEKTSMGTTALVLQFYVDGFGLLTLQTCLLPEREEPYLLSLELARHRLMKLIAKQEDWAMWDLEDDSAANRRLDVAKHEFMDALNYLDDLGECDRIARDALAAALDASEELALEHADLLLERRVVARQPFMLGCGVDLKAPMERICGTLQKNFDYVHAPTPWRQLEPEEQEYDWERLDAWCEWAYRSKMPIAAGPMVSFTSDNVPDWMYIWEHDYDTVRDILYEHIERLVTRYRSVVSVWNVVSGVHVNKNFCFNFEQLMDLTRMAVMLTRKLHPAGKTLIEIAQPFGEYYANNQRSIPPVMYFEMLIQQGIPCDAFGIRLLMGSASDGLTTRDLLQISSLLDRFNGLGKPIHITAVGVPSEPPEAIANVSEQDPSQNLAAGFWRKPWSDTVQAKWLEAFYNIAVSKPFVESVSWADLTDHSDATLPTGGLVSGDLKPKRSLRSLVSFKGSFNGSG